MTETRTGTRMVTVRWLFFIPGAVVLALVTGLVITLIADPESIFGFLLLAASAGFVFVFGGSFLAPSKDKTIPAVVLLIIVGVLFAKGFFNISQSGFRGDSIDAGIGLVVLLAGAIAGLWLVRRLSPIGSKSLGLQ